MTLKERIDSDYLSALKQGRALEVSVARFLKTAIKNAEIDKKAELSEEEVIAVIEKQANQRRDSIEQYTKAGRDDLRVVEENELQVMNAYLPEKLSEEEIASRIKEILATVGEEKNFGKIMGLVMKDLKGKADPALISKVLKENLEA